MPADDPVGSSAEAECFCPVWAGMDVNVGGSRARAMEDVPAAEAIQVILVERTCGAAAPAF